LEIIGMADERSYPMPFTQELISDALGRSVPHVNRTLPKLRNGQFYFAFTVARLVLSS
jgi:hypothetical protein